VYLVTSSVPLYDTCFACTSRRREVWLRPEKLNFSRLPTGVQPLGDFSKRIS
jgi:hypothetical protein